MPETGKDNLGILFLEAYQLKNKLQEGTTISQEEARESIFSVLDRAIKSNFPLDLDEYLFTNHPLGDNILAASAALEAVEQYSSNIGVAAPEAVFSSQRGIPLGGLITKYESRFFKDQIYPNVRVEYATPPADILHLQHPDGASELPPKAYRVNGNPKLGDWNQEDAETQSQKLKEELGAFTLICQAGSKANKKFSDAQIRDLEDQCKSRNPIILRDSEVRSLPKLSPFLLAAEQIITTDTSWAWWAGAVHRSTLGDDRVRSVLPKKLIVLHTTTDEYWHVPCSTSIYGKASHLAKKSALRQVMSEGSYKNFFPTPEDGIHSEDFAEFLEKLERL